LNRETDVRSSGRSYRRNPRSRRQRRRGARHLEIRGEIANLTNRLNVLNFAGLFSGTAVAPPRSGGVRPRLEF